MSLERKTKLVGFVRMADENCRSAISPPPMKKQKIDTDIDTDTDTDTGSGSSSVGGSLPGSGSDADAGADIRSRRRVYPLKELRYNPDSDDDEAIQQRCSYWHQLHRTEGFEIDWNQLDYRFQLAPIDWLWQWRSDVSNEEFVREVALYAIDQYSKEKGTKLVFVELVEANFMTVKGIVLWITFLARDSSASDPELRLYQTKVWYIRRTDIRVEIFRPRPTDKEMDAIEVPHYSPERY